MSLKVSAVIGVVALGIGFTGGWKVNGWRLGEQIADEKAAVHQAFEIKRTELFAEFTVQREKDVTARLALSQDLRKSQAREAGLLKEVETLQLSKSDPQIVVETVVETITEVVQGECIATEIVIANPFSNDFVRLWNESSSGAGAGSPE